MIAKDHGFRIKEMKYWAQHTSTCQEIDFHPTIPWLASVGWDNTLKIYDIVQDTTIFTQEFPKEVRYCQFCLNGYFLAAATDKTIFIFRVNHSRPENPLEEVKTLDNGDTSCWSVAFSPNSKLLAVMLFNTKVHIYETESWQEVAEMKQTSRTNVHGSFSPNSRFLAVCGSKDNELNIFNCQGPPASWHVVCRKKLNFEGRKVIWSLNGQFLMVCQWGEESYIYNTADWTINTKITTEDKLLGGDFSKDQHILALANESGHFLLYRYLSAGTWDLCSTSLVKESFPWDIKFSPHNKWLAACFHDGHILLMEYDYIFEQPTGYF